MVAGILVSCMAYGLQSIFSLIINMVPLIRKVRICIKMFPEY